MNNKNIEAFKMPYWQRSQWIQAIIPALLLIIYGFIMYNRSDGFSAVADTRYWDAMLGIVVAWIVFMILGHILLAILGHVVPMISGRVTDDAQLPKPTKRDPRERDIERYGEYIGQRLLSCLSGVVIIFAVFKIEYFWIANSVFTATILSAIVAAIVKFRAFNKPFQQL